MKISQTMLILCASLLSSCLSPSTYTVKVLKHEKNYFADWGEVDGTPFENRYDAIVCEVLGDGKHICNIAVYQHWFKKDRKDYPAVGSELTIRKFDFSEQMFNPTPGLYTIELDAFEKLKTGRSSIHGKMETGSDSIIVNELIKSTQTWDGALLSSYPQGQPEISIRRITVPPGARLAVHHHPVINAGFLLSGELTVVTADGKRMHLKAGDPIIELVNTEHYGMNQGKVPAEVLVFCAGAVGLQTTTIGSQTK